MDEITLSLEEETESSGWLCWPLCCKGEGHRQRATHIKLQPLLEIHQSPLALPWPPSNISQSLLWWLISTLQRSATVSPWYQRNTHPWRSGRSSSLMSCLYYSLLETLSLSRMHNIFKLWCKVSNIGFMAQLYGSLWSPWYCVTF